MVSTSTWLLTAVIALGGCSLLLQEREQVDNEPDAGPDCTPDQFYDVRHDVCLTEVIYAHPEANPGFNCQTRSTPCPTLEAAIEALTTERRTIVMLPGEYNDTEVDYEGEPLRIIGPGAVVVPPDQLNGTVLTINNSTVTVEQVRFSGQGLSVGSVVYGVVALGASHLELYQTEFTGFLHSVSVRTSSNTLSGSLRVLGNRISADPDSNADIGIAVADMPTHIESTFIEDASYGVSIGTVGSNFDVALRFSTIVRSSVSSLTCAGGPTGWTGIGLLILDEGGQDPSCLPYTITHSHRAELMGETNIQSVPELDSEFVPVPQSLALDHLPSDIEPEFPFDVRGLPRVSSGLVDVGAFEFQQQP